MAGATRGDGGPCITKHLLRVVAPGAVPTPADNGRAGVTASRGLLADERDQCNNGAQYFSRHLSANLPIPLIANPITQGGAIRFFFLTFESRFSSSAKAEIG